MVHTSIPKKERFGDISYKYPPNIVKMAVLQLSAKAEYTPCALGICSFGKLCVIYIMKAKCAIPNDKACNPCEIINIQTLGNRKTSNQRNVEPRAERTNKEAGCHFPKSVSALEKYSISKITPMLIIIPI